MSELSIAESIRQDYEEEINKKEAMYDSLAVDYRLAQEEIERLKDLIKALWNNNSTSNLNDKQLELLDNIIFDKEKDNE